MVRDAVKHYLSLKEEHREISLRRITLGRELRDYGDNNVVNSFKRYAKKLIYKFSSKRITVYVSGSFVPHNDSIHLVITIDDNTKIATKNRKLRAIFKNLEVLLPDSILKFHTYDDSVPQLSIRMKLEVIDSIKYYLSLDIESLKLLIELS